MARPEAIKVWRESIAQAFEHAQKLFEPVFVPASIYTDDRGWSIMNQLQGVMHEQGQVNYSVMYPGVIKAWHRHVRQTDFWMCLHGHMKVGVHREDGKSWMMVIGEKQPGTVVIPPTLWHGAGTVGPESAGLLYYVTHAYDPAAPDEQRMAHDEVPDFPWEVQHR